MMTAEFEQKVHQMDTEALVDFALGTENFRLFAAKRILASDHWINSSSATQVSSVSNSPLYLWYMGALGDLSFSVSLIVVAALTKSSFFRRTADACKRYFDLFQQTFGVDVRNLAQT